MYTWHYTAALPWGLISMGIILFALLVSSIYYYYRRRTKLKAMQRFAQKRLRRKMKVCARARRAGASAGERAWLLCARTYS